MPMKKIAVVVASRANYGSIKMAMRAIAAHPDLDLQVIVAASAVLDRYGAVEDVITPAALPLATKTATSFVP